MVDCVATVGRAGPLLPVPLSAGGAAGDGGQVEWVIGRWHCGGAGTFGFGAENEVVDGGEEADAAFVVVVPVEVLGLTEVGGVEVARGDGTGAEDGIGASLGDAPGEDEADDGIDDGLDGAVGIEGETGLVELLCAAGAGGAGVGGCFGGAGAGFVVDAEVCAFAWWEAAGFAEAGGAVAEALHGLTSGGV